MARLLGVARVEAQAVAASTTETIIGLAAPANQRVVILGWGISFDGVTVTDNPVKIQLGRYTAGTATTAVTPVKLDDSIAEALQTDYEHTFTAEPTYGDELDTQFVHPQSGWEKFYPLGQEPIVGGGDKAGIWVTTGANPTGGLNVHAFIRFEE